MAKAPFALLSLFFTAAAIVLLLLVVLAGTENVAPLNLIYFMRADTADIDNAPPMSQWTLWNYCEMSESGRNENCGAIKPAYPFDPPGNFGESDAIPETFVGTKKFFLLSRFMFAFIFIGLFFAVCSLFTGLLALCSRLGGALSGLLASIALFWQAGAAALMTACYVLGRDNFRAEDRFAEVGNYAFAFMWTAAFCLLLATIFFFLVLGKGKTEKTRSSRGGLFGRKRSTRSQGSFFDRKTDYS
ncbi:MAG: hypothetical protein M1833_006021 [Piccolia ochrophora]|nr:MAG: hypothetical protein M1833_006021 [Piccolia ochrophora]